MQEVEANDAKERELQEQYTQNLAATFSYDLVVSKTKVRKDKQKVVTL